MTADPLQTLEKDIGHSFANRGILQQALRHSSYTGAKKVMNGWNFLGIAS